MRFMAKGMSANGPSTHSMMRVPSWLGHSLARVTMTPPSSMDSHIGPSMKPHRKILVPTWQSGAAVTATTKYSRMATHAPGKRRASTNTNSDTNRTPAASWVADWNLSDSRKPRTASRGPGCHRLKAKGALLLPAGGATPFLPRSIRRHWTPRNLIQRLNSNKVAPNGRSFIDRKDR